MTLGARSPDVNRMVLLQGLKPALAGVIIGVVAAAFATRILQSQLFGCYPADPITFVVVPLLPAIRATRLDPTDALRAE